VDVTINRHCLHLLHTLSDFGTLHTHFTFTYNIAYLLTRIHAVITDHRQINVGTKARAEWLQFVTVLVHHYIFRFSYKFFFRNTCSFLLIYCSQLDFFGQAACVNPAQDHHGVISASLRQLFHWRRPSRCQRIIWPREIYANVQTSYTQWS